MLQFQGISLMRCNITCLLGLFLYLTRIVYFISLINDYIVICRVFVRLYCWRIRLFRFFLASDDCYWVTIAGESNCEGACDVDELDSCCGVDKDNLDLFSSSLVISLFVIVYISGLKLFIIAYRALIVIDNSIIATWFVDILLNNRII